MNERSFEIVAGARRYGAAQLADVATVSVRIINLSDAEALEAQLIENLQRRDAQDQNERRRKLETPKGNSRSPSGMTARKARATAIAKTEQRQQQNNDYGKSGGKKGG